MGIVDRAELVRRAEVDPWAYQAQLASGSPAEIFDLAAAFYRASGHIEQAAAAEARSTGLQRRGFTVDGAAPIDVSVCVRTTAAHLADASDTLPRIAATLQSVATELRFATRAVDAEVRTLDAALADLETQWSEFSATRGSHVPLDERELARTTTVNAAVERVRAAGRGTTAAVFGYEEVLGSATKRLSDLGFVAPAELATAGETFVAPPPPWMPPGQVAQWWRTLTPAEQEYLLDHDAVALAMLGGLPAWVSDRANRQRLRSWISRLRQRQRRLANDDNRVANQPKLWQVNGQLAQATALEHELASTGPDGGPVYLLSFADDLGGTSGSMVAYGDPDAADNTAVMVPGTNVDPSDSHSLGGSARALYRSMSGQRSVVVWLDGREPRDAEAAFDGSAEAAAPRLVSDLVGLRAAHDVSAVGGGHLTVIGHSYGSVIAGAALREGAPVDDVAFIGSPGVGVDHARDLGVDPSHVWSGQASDDPILVAGHRFTPDPLTGNNPAEGAFGARHFDVRGAHGHSGYYDRGTQSLASLGRIASGDYAAVHTTGAPDLAGVLRLPGDAVDVALTPKDTVDDAVIDLVRGHPDDAWDRVVRGGRDEWRAVGDLGDDIDRVTRDGVSGVKTGLSILEQGSGGVLDTVGGLVSGGGGVLRIGGNTWTR